MHSASGHKATIAVAGRHIHFIDQFSKWLSAGRVPIDEISTKHIERYVRYRRRRLKPDGCDASAPTHFVSYLRERGVLRAEQEKDLSELDRVIADYSRYLLNERTLSPSTERNYRLFAIEFLEDRFGNVPIDFSALSGADILHFVRLRAPECGSRVKLMGTALRSFLGYLQYKGHIETNLAFAVPKVAHRSNVGLQKVLSQTQIDLLISSRCGSTPLQRRDYAMFLLLARLGLRAGEVVSLKLDDIDWEDASLIVRGKGNHWARMPLSAEVGEAIAKYLTEARPTSELRTVFLSAKAPVSCLTPAGLSTRVKHAINSVGIDAPNHGAHQFRHSLATNMLKNGAALGEIGEVLRHRSTQTTEVYAKVDVASLRQLALPWPGGVR